MMDDGSRFLLFYTPEIFINKLFVRRLGPGEHFLGGGGGGGRRWEEVGGGSNKEPKCVKCAIS